MDETVKYWTCSNERRRNARANLIFLGMDGAASVFLLIVGCHQEDTN